MNKNAKIELSGLRTDENGENDVIKLSVEGSYCLKNNIHYITYDEKDLPGFEGSKCTVKIDGEKVTIVRFGVSTFIFEKGMRHTGYYNTPYGTFHIGVKSYNIDIDIGENGGSINISYLLDFAENTSKNAFILNFTVN